MTVTDKVKEQMRRKWYALTLRVPIEEIEVWREAAYQQRMTLSEWIRKCCRG